MKHSRLLGPTLIVAGFSGWLITADWQSVEASEPLPALEKNSETSFTVVGEIRKSGAQSLIHRYMGRLSASETVVIKTQVSGTISSVGVVPGQQVSKGDLLFTIDSDLLAGQIEKARSAVREAEDKFNSVNRLLQKSFASTAEYNESKTQLDEARSNLNALLDELENTRIRATVNGALPLDLPKVGDFVQSGAELVELAVLSDKKIRVQVPPSSAALFANSQEDDLKVRVGDLTLKGTVRAISTIVNPGDSSISIDIDVSNSKDILPGTIAKVELRETIEGAHLIESNLLELDGDGHPVVKVIDGSTVDTLALENFRHSSRGLVVTGWPETIHLITRGGGFVASGEKVIVKCEVNCDNDA